MPSLIYSRDSLLQKGETIQELVMSYIPMRYAESQAIACNAARTPEDIDAHVHYEALYQDFTQQEFNN